MPGRRPDKKGSFGSHLDELVRVFEPGPAKKMYRPKEPASNEGDDVHDRLFESAWRAARERDGAGSR